MQYAGITIEEASRRFREKTLSPVELTDFYLKRIERLNPSLNAFITVIADRALREAGEAWKEIKNGNRKGPLHGIPVAVKDMFDTADVKTTAAFEQFKARRPQKDAVLVEKLREAGAIVLGKTNLHQLAMGTTSVVSFYGAVHNPWNKEYIAGVSSGGSAAAVAAGLCLATIDTDAIGSCRLPASCCGVTGFKPTNGILSPEGILAGEKADNSIFELATPALTTRTAADAAICLGALTAGLDNSPLKAEKIARSIKIGLVKNFKGDSGITDDFQTAVRLIKSLNYETAEIAVPFEKASFDISKIDGDHREVSKTIFSDVDLILLPTAAEETPKIVEAEAREKSGAGHGVAFSADNTFFCNYFGLPAVTVPGGFSRHGLPWGIQIAGRPGHDLEVPALAEKLQDAGNKPLKYPAI